MTIAFIIIFGLIAILSKTHYKTATVICGVSIVNLLAYDWLVPIEPVSMFMILASFDMIVALFLIYVYGDGRREYMAALLILASFAHCFIGMSATFDNYIYYDLYANSITAVDLLQLIIMWGCVNVRDVLLFFVPSNFSHRCGHSNNSLNSTHKEEG